MALQTAESLLTYQQFVQYVRQAVPRFNVAWLNPEQNAAVEASPHPPTFIVAGPGAGKTTVLALRALKLVLVDGLHPQGVIATTFTRKAADELRSRILAWGYAVISYARTASSNHPQLQEWLRSAAFRDDAKAWFCLSRRRAMPAQPSTRHD